MAGFEIRMGNQHHTTRAQNGRACQRGCIPKAPFGAALSPKRSDLVRLDDTSRSLRVTPVVAPPSGRAGRDSEVVVGAIALISKPVPNVSAGKGDSPSRPTDRFVAKGQRLGVL